MYCPRTAIAKRSRVPGSFQPAIPGANGATAVGLLMDSVENLCVPLVRHA